MTSQVDHSTPAILHEFAMKRQGIDQDPDDRAAIPRATLLDAYDLRCQYCPGQAFRRSKLRAQDLWLILRMRYSARCLRCGQRQVVSFTVAASAVPSHYKQARNMRNTETWREFTQNSAPERAAPARGKDTAWDAVSAAVVPAAARSSRERVTVGVDSTEYRLKDGPVRAVVDQRAEVPEQAARSSASGRTAVEVKPATPPLDDQAIW